MNHRERLEACLSGKPIDRPPVALWRHFPVDDQYPHALAESTLLFQHAYDFDFVKITPASSFCVKDYSVEDVWKGNPEGTREYTRYPIKQPSEWKTLELLDPTNGYLGMQLECIKNVRAGLSEDTPVLQTIFDPLSQAKNLVGKQTLLHHLRQNSDELIAGLETLTQTTIIFIHECIKLGIDGIFFAIQHAQASLVTIDEFQKFVYPFDQRILEHTSSLWLNIAHLHGNDLYFQNIPTDNIAVINWHDQETAPSLAEAKKQFGGVVCGGLRQWETLVYGTPADVYQEAGQAIEKTDGNRFILGTGCVLPIIAPHSNIMAARNAVEKVKP